MNMFDILKEILVSEKEFNDTNYQGFKKAMSYIKNNLIDSDGNMYLTVNYLIEVKIIIVGSNNITFIKVNVKSYGFDKIYIEKDLLEDKFYRIIDQINERKITPVKFYLIFLNEIHPFYDGNGRTC